MNNAWWGIVAVLAVGVAVVAYGWLSDRTATRRRERALASPPGGGPVPAYVTGPPRSRPPAELDDAGRAALREALPDAATVAAAFGPTLLRTLAANAAHRAFANLPVALDAAGREAVCAATGAAPVPAADLHAGYVPADALGTCRAWIADQNVSWIVPEKDIPEKLSM